MFNRKYLMLFLILTVILITISAVSANDLNVTQKALTSDDGEMAVELSDDETDTYLSLDEEELQASDNCDELVLAGQKTFTDLNKAINGNKNRNVNLNYDYTFDSSKDSKFIEGIRITRSVTINGNGHTLDGSNLARIFFVSHHSVVFKNINFVNGNVDGSGEQVNGGAIFGYSKCYNCNFIDNTAVNAGAMHDGVAYNCKFINNHASYWGGAAYYISAYNCEFIGNIACYGGALWYCFAAKNCSFTNNSASLYGGAGKHIPAVNCRFENNQARYGGALDDSSAINCVFIDNVADNGGATCDSIVNNCKFTDNYATEYGGAMYGGSVIKSKFTYNEARISGNDLYKTETQLKSQIVLKDSMDLYCSNKYVIATLKDSMGYPIKNAKVTIKLVGKKNRITKTTKTNSKGQITLSTFGVPYKEYGYDVYVTFGGNTYFVKSSASKWFFVYKSTPKITAKSMKYKAKATKKYKITVKTRKGVAIKNKRVTLKVNKKVYKSKTNKKGQATFKIKLTKRGTYKAIIKSFENGYYKIAYKTSKITIK